MRADAAPYDIADLAREADVSARTIRYYGELGLLPPARRGPGGRRVYDADALERLRFITRLKHLGLALQEIRELHEAFERGRTPAMLDRLEDTLEGHLERVDERIEALGRLHQELRTYLERIRAKRRPHAG